MARVIANCSGEQPWMNTLDVLVEASECTVFMVEKDNPTNNLEFGYRFLCPLCEMIEVKMVSEADASRVLAGGGQAHDKVIMVTEDPDAYYFKANTELTATSITYDDLCDINGADPALLGDAITRDLDDPATRPLEYLI